MESLSIPQARKLVLLSQRVLTVQGGSAQDATLSAIEHLGYIQIDAISVIERAHHHTLWNRNPRYQSSQLEQLVESRQVFEYWAHAAAYLPMRDYRFSLPRKQSLASGAQSHWYERDEVMMRWVSERIENEGPLMAKDFEVGENKVGEWEIKPAKRALEYLFMQGDLMASRRINFQKVYDLTERVLPENIDTTQPSSTEYARFLITGYLRANGLGQAAEIAYLLKKTKPLVAATLAEMVSNEELIQIRVEGQVFYALVTALELLGKPLRRRRLKILSPFDNLVIQRERMKRLFDFDYLIECYVPMAKRRYGYFSLPILWDGRMVARMDCKAERNLSLLHIHHLALEAKKLDLDSFCSALRRELKLFLSFNQCTRIQLHRTTPMDIKSSLQAEFDKLIS
ncbi:MAG: winged helix-turn-helix domain-containing protein [Roseibacillus sp.]